MSSPNYCYLPDYIVLRNRLDIRDAPALEAAERQFVAQRHLEPVPAGDFDRAHLMAIHRHLFQDLYAWAGEVRTVEMAKGRSCFQPRRFIATGMADVPLCRRRRCWPPRAAPPSHRCLHPHASLRREERFGRERGAAAVRPGEGVPPSFPIIGMKEAAS